MAVIGQDDISDLGTILCVGAHPDDETFMAGGLLSVAAANGQQVICVTATKGEAGSQDLTKWPAETLGQVRADELAAALKVLGIKKHHWLNYSDGQCDKVDQSEAVKQMVALIDDYQPDTILTFGPDGLTGHPDHKSVSAWVTAAAKESKNKPQIYHAVLTVDQYAKYLKTVHDKLNFFYNIDQPPTLPANDCDILVTCNDYACEAKQSAFTAMPSQYASMFAAFDSSFLAEAFRVEAFVKA